MIKDSKSLRTLSYEDKPISIFELSLSNLESVLVEIGQPKYRARQIWRAVYAEGRSSFDEMTNVSKQLKSVLPKVIAIDLLVPKLYSTSKDRSTDKALFPLSDGELIETVLMRYSADGHRRRRKTVCISTQAGCALGCTFCATGQQGFSRNLSVGEIVKQVLYMEKVARREDMLDIENGNRTIGELQGITNVVFMGMGEPLANYENTLSAVKLLNDPKGINIGARHITISTVGLVPQILKLAKEKIQINLAISLHAPDDITRNKTMPINKRYPIEQLVDACKKYVEITGRKVFFEYVLLKGQNDSSEHAKKLARLLSKIMCQVNLIPVNPTNQSSYQRTDKLTVEAFKDNLKTMGIPSTVRVEKGIDINAGCGQLRARVLNKSNPVH